MIMTPMDVSLNTIYVGIVFKHEGAELNDSLYVALLSILLFVHIGSSGEPHTDVNTDNKVETV